MSTESAISKAARWIVIGFAILWILPGCGTTAEKPKLEPSPDYARAADDFGAAYDELVASVRATPHWKVRPYRHIPHNIVGQWEIARAKADALAPFIAHGQISPATIALAKLQCDYTADEVLEPQTLRRDVELDGKTAQLYHDQELAFQRLRRFLPWLEQYVSDGIRSPWVEETILARMLVDQSHVADTAYDSTWYWTREAPIRGEIFEDYRARAAAWASAYRALVAGERTTPAIPESAPESAPATSVGN